MDASPISILPARSPYISHKQILSPTDYVDAPEALPYQPRTLAYPPPFGYNGAYQQPEEQSRKRICGLSILNSCLLVVILLLGIALAVVAGVLSSKNAALQSAANNPQSQSEDARTGNSNASSVSSSSAATPTAVTITVTASVTASSATSTSTIVLATDSGCATDFTTTNGTTYKAFNGGVFQRVCNADATGNDLLRIISPSFEACMEVCGDWNSRELGAACVGVSMVPSWYDPGATLKDQLSGIRKTGNYFLKAKVVAGLLSDTARFEIVTGVRIS